MSFEKRRASDDVESLEYTHRDHRWKLSREVSIPTLLAFAVYAFGGIWWAATISAEIHEIRRTVVHNGIVQAGVDQRQDTEAVRAESRVMAQLERMGGKLDRLIENSK